MYINLQELTSPKVANTENEIFRIRRGIGRFGKLWTGDRPSEGALVTSPRIVLRQCQHCGNTTNQFRADVIETTLASHFEFFDNLPIRDLWLFAGGVGSLPPAVDQLATALNVPVCVTNWSGRVGGAVLIAPEAVVSGRGDSDTRQAPWAPPGYKWHYIYSGESLHQWVMLPESGEIPDDREIEVVCPRGPAGDGRHTCPRCAERIQKILMRDETLETWHTRRRPEDDIVGFTSEGLAWFAQTTGNGHTGYPVKVDTDGTITWNCITPLPDFVEEGAPDA